MSTRVLSALTAAAVLSGAAAVAQSNDQTSREIEAEDMPITVVGCLQRESDYRRMNNLGGAPPGLGTGDEFVLVDSAGDCATLAPGAAAYELTGEGEDHLKGMVGRRVEISGILKGGDLTVDGRAEGGFDPLGRDLRLREVSVTAGREVSGAQIAGATGAAGAPGSEEPLPVGTSGELEAVDERLPRTASPLALASLLGLLSATGGIGVRAVRRRLAALR